MKNAAVWILLVAILLRFPVFSDAPKASARSKLGNGCTPLDWIACLRMSESKAKLERAERLRANGGKSGAIETKR